MTDAIADLRRRIEDADRAVLDAVNRRIELVAAIKREKAERGIDFVDPNREAELLDALAAANAGPLSDEGLRELFRTILDLVKRELEDRAGS